jgi:lysozyme
MPKDENPRAHEQVTATAGPVQPGLGKLPDQKPQPQQKKTAPPKPAPPAHPTALSPDGAKFIARFEGFRSHMYNDAANHCTIGYGHLVHYGPINGSEPEEFRRGLNEQQALDLLRQDAAKAVAAVRECVTVPLNQQQFDALVSFAYNEGGGALASSTLVKMLNQGQYDAIPEQLGRWNKAGNQVLQGLVTRRAAEGTLFTHGTYA